MINKLIPIVLTLVAVGGAGFAAKTLRGGEAPSADYEAAGKDGYEKGKDGKGGVHAVKAEKDDDGLGFFNFQRNFVVPIIRSDSVDAIVLLAFTVEMEDSAIEEVKIREPKVRDAFMKELLTMSYEGLFDKDITNPQVYETIQTRLTDRALEVMDESVTTVLLVDFARQDQR